MMTTVSHRAVTGCRAFTSVCPRVASRVVHSTTVHARNKDSFMIEVDVMEDEPEDAAVRRYMKLMMQSRVVEQLRGRKTKETKIENYKRRFRERVERNKAGIVDPTFEELYPTWVMEARPFDDSFQKRDDDDPLGPFDPPATGSDDIFGTFGGSSYTERQQWGSYQSSTTGGYASLGNTSNWQGGYMQ
ncbi:hypothetical protein TSOC_005888 [Tetrabaena socialis]|uniref:30S ribosomal protein S21, chloroplastic n=1 Tax=Tetrabaena socialis TaxID=47790 RepID=A0A2J8A546_9CHLO|nr:hypothetical protein TSOC_005888 [Tetrabaena socialis]|eukprot:PNH07638.1 hypothetical protein TSOC_005888 [Tetrabaena socialis]